MPRAGVGLLAWIALTPLCLAVVRVSGARAFLLGLTTGAVFFAGTVSWTSDVLAIFGGLNAALAWLLAALLIAYLAIYPALFAVGLRTAIARAGLRALAIAPCLWVGTEWLRGTLFTGFPWVLLAYSQSETLAPLQVASLVGAYGLSGFVACGSTAIALLAVSTRAGGDERRALRRAAVACVVLVIAGWAWGAWRIRQGDLVDGPAVRVGIVQGNVPQDEKWDPIHRDRILERYLSLTTDVAKRGVDLVVWPESSTPFVYGRDVERTMRMRNAITAAQVPVVFGSDEIVSPTEFYNAAMLVDARGGLRGSYRKMQLVPFGEYIPVRPLLFFASPLVEGFSDFSAGDRITLLPVGTHQLSVAVCYEAVFPWHARAAVAAGSELLTTITNDAWYGRSAAPFQHFEQARVRAVENGRYLVRAANTGISGIVDPYGRVTVRSPLFETGTWTGEVRWRTGRTVYGAIGDAVARACTLVTAGVLALGFWPARRGLRKESVWRVS